MRRIALVPILAAVFAVAACSSGSGSSSGPATPVGASAPAASAAGSAAASGAGGGGAACAAAPAGSTAAVTVAIKDFKFAPQPVAAKVGDVIAWSNQDAAPHSATLDDGTCDTKTINSGAQAMLIFNAPGTYSYHCSVHPGQMKDYTIEVK